MAVDDTRGCDAWKQRVEGAYNNALRKNRTCAAGCGAKEAYGDNMPPLAECVYG